MTWLAWSAVIVATVPAALRWLRVAQREHYLPGSVLVAARRWTVARPPNAVLLAAVVVAVVAAVAGWGPAALVVAAGWAVFPWPLSWRGRTSPLAWTARLRRLAGLWAVLVAGAVGILLLTLGGEPGTAALAPPVAFAVMDLALLVAGPIEHRLSQRFVDRAAATLARVDPVVVAITGSYGKTSTKEYLRHLLSGSRNVVASPASFNNRMGLARAVNEHVAPGTEVFIAEMGTYGPSEIADLCRWCCPRISIITAIGPVHLERFGTLEAIVEAKSEILDGAEVAILNYDDPRLAAVADRAESRLRIIRVSAEAGGDITARAEGAAVTVEAFGSRLGTFESDVFPANLAAAVAAALELGVAPDVVAARISSLPAAEHRQSQFVGESGFTVIDDTFNSNPAGAAAGLARLSRAAPPPARRVVVTPGMVELGTRQAGENRLFAQAAAEAADDLVIVGWTNRRALQRGASGGGASVIVVPDREAAVAWVRARLGPGDAVLYENDLPDHYP